MISNAEKGVRRRLRNRLLIKHWKSGGCQAVGCNERNDVCLDAHHVNGRDANIHMSKLGTKSLANELAKCVCVCANHHRKIHGGMKIRFKKGWKQRAEAVLYRYRN